MQKSLNAKIFSDLYDCQQATDGAFHTLHQHQRLGMPPTGKPVAVAAMNIYEIENGKIVREHGLPDLFNIMIQLGDIAAPKQ